MPEAVLNSWNEIAVYFGEPMSDFRR